MQECAEFLTASARAGDDEKKLRFTRLFFETYGGELAALYGCSRPVFDHQVLAVGHPELFILWMHLLLKAGIVEGPSDRLARNLHAVFDTGFTLSTLQRKLREESDGFLAFYDEWMALCEKLRENKLI